MENITKISLIMLKTSVTGAPKTAATGYLIDSNIANKFYKENSPRNNSDFFSQTEEKLLEKQSKRYVPPEKRQQITEELRLM